MTRLTTPQKNGLTNQSVPCQKGTLGARIDALEYGTVETPSAGTIAPLAFINYTTAPAVGTATATHADIALAQTVTTDVTTEIANPDYPRILTIKGNAAAVTGNVVITGTDFDGTVITDTIASSGTAEVLGVKAFKTVTNINVPPYAVANTERISIGRGNKIGFPIAIPNASVVIAKSFDGAADNTTVTASATLSLSLAAPTGTFNGIKLYELVFSV